MNSVSFLYVTDDVDEFFENAKDQINDHLGGKCITDAHCYFFQECELMQCKVRTWAWVVFIAGVTAIVVGCCCCACNRKQKMTRNPQEYF